MCSVPSVRTSPSSRLERKRLFHDGRVRAERRHLEDLAALEVHVGEPEPAPNQPAVPEQALHLVRRRAGGDVEVFRRAPDQRVAHAAADQVALVAVLLEPQQHAHGVGVEQSHQSHRSLEALALLVGARSRVVEQMQVVDHARRRRRRYRPQRSDALA
jgi:hypothetical protein